MKKPVIILGIIALIAGGCNANFFCQTNKKEVKMIEYIPKEFHTVKLGFHESSENVCTPYFPQTYLKIDNQIVINVPQKVISNHQDSLMIPLCGVYKISERRGLKYEHLSTPIIHVRKIEEETWQTGKIIDQNSGFSSERPESEEEESKRQQAIKEAQKYSDDELNEKTGYAFGKAINVSIVRYVHIPFEQGIYEVFVSMFGLESNRVQVEIVFNNK